MLPPSLTVFLLWQSTKQSSICHNFCEYPRTIFGQDRLLKKCSIETQVLDMATGLQDVHLITSLRVFQGGPSIWQECSGLSKLVLEIGEIIGDIGELCAHIGIRYQRPKSREASGFTPKLFLPSAFYISLSDHMQLVFFTDKVKMLNQMLLPSRLNPNSRWSLLRWHWPTFFNPGLTQPRGWGWGRRWARGNYRLS